GRRPEVSRWRITARACAVMEWCPSSGGGESPQPGRSAASLPTRSSSRGIRADQFCEEPPRPCTYRAGGRPSRAGRRERTVSVTPGSSTDLTCSPSATLTAATSDSTSVGGTNGSSGEDMRAMLRDDHTADHVFALTEPPPGV